MLRIYGCELIQEGCHLLKMPQVAMCTGQVLFHRFYYKVSFKSYDVETAAMAGLFLAAKREECSPGGSDKNGRTVVKIRDFINVWHNMKQRRMGTAAADCVPINSQGEIFAGMKAALAAYERMLLKKLGCALTPLLFPDTTLSCPCWSLTASLLFCCPDSFSSWNTPTSSASTSASSSISLS